MLLLVLDALACLALKPLLDLKVEDGARVWLADPVFELDQLVEEIVEVLGRILHLTGLELWVAFADERLEHSWPNTILVEFIGCFRFFLLLGLCGQFLLRVLAAAEPVGQLVDLRVGILRRILQAGIKVLLRWGRIPLLESRLAEEYLHD